MSDEIDRSRRKQPRKESSIFCSWINDLFILLATQTAPFSLSDGRTAFERYIADEDTVLDQAHLLYVLAEQGLANLGKALIDDKVDVNACAEGYATALQGASLWSHE